MEEFVENKQGKNQLLLPYFSNYVMKIAKKANCMEMLNLPLQLMLPGPLDEKKLEASIQRVIDENDVLRSSIVENDSDFYFKTRKKYNYKLEKVVVEGVTLEEKKDKLQKIIDKKSNEPMDIVNSIVFTAILYELSKEEHCLLIIVHHALYDAISISMTIPSILGYYNNESYIDNQVETASFFEFLEEEDKFSKSSKAKEQMEYWQNEFEGHKKFEYTPDKNKEIFNARQLPCVLLDKEKLKEVASNNKTSIFNVIMLLCHLSFALNENNNESTINFSIANRNEPKYMNTFGFLTKGVDNRMIFKDSDVISELHKKERQKISLGLKNAKMSKFNSDYVVSYVSDLNYNVKPAMFNNEIVKYSMPGVVRKFPFLAIGAYEREKDVLLMYQCDTQIFDMDYLKKLTKIFNIVYEEIIKDAKISFQQLRNIVNENFEDEENIILI